MTTQPDQSHTERPAPARDAPLAELCNTAVALPGHVVTRAALEQVVAARLGELGAGSSEAETTPAADAELASRAAAILGNAGVARRHLVRPPVWYLEHRSVTERSRVYREEMIRLCESAAGEALAGAGLAPADIGMLITTSCTGLMIPSVDAYLVNRMGFPASVRRLPVTELGCAAGAVALSRAADHLRAYPEQAVLVVAAELASLTAQVSDLSMANIVSVALFGDGAAATVLTGPRFPGSQAQEAVSGEASGVASGGRLPARIVATHSMLFPDTEDMMGFDNTDGGLKIFLRPKVPRFLRAEVPKVLGPFLAGHGLTVADLAHTLLHPGGPKVLRGLEQRLRLRPEQTALSWRVLRDYGNLSSATVLFLLHHFEREARPRPGDWGLLMAVGPGFALELVLLRW